MQPKGKMSIEGSSGAEAQGSKAVSRFAKAGLEFPVGRIERLLKKGTYASRIKSEASVYLAAVLEYMAAEMLELAGKEAKKGKGKRITPSHIQMAVEQDEELSKLLGNNVTFSNSSVL